MVGVGSNLVIDPDFSTRSVDAKSLKKKKNKPFEVSSTWGWNANDVFGEVESTLYLVFTTADPRSIDLKKGTIMVDHDESKVGLRIDGADGWVLLRTSAPGGGTLYYPAVALSTVPTNLEGEVDVRYVLEQVLTYKEKGKKYLPLPKLRIAMAVVPIPEPGTALLLALGLCGLAVRARARS
jgi:hypothetical protein